MINTKQIQNNIDKKLKKENLKLYHKELFNKLNLSNPFYSPKMAYFDDSVKIVSFFLSELQKEEDIYTEFVSRDYDSEDVNRVLYKWIYNPNYVNDYKTNAHEQQVVENPHLLRYLIPVDELIKCEDLLKQNDLFEMPDPDQDLPIDQLTIRDLTAILTGKPVSMKSWLNEIIKK